MTTTPEAFIQELRAAPTQVRKQLAKTAESFSRELHDKIVDNASGRPGPEIVTGQYVSSISVEYIINNDVLSINAGSDSPQTYRLEMGFSGIDELGRHYSTPPFPHFRPAADELEQKFEDLMADCGDLNILSNRGDD